MIGRIWIGPSITELSVKNSTPLVAQMLEMISVAVNRATITG